MSNVHLSVLMFGTDELKSVKNAYCRAKRFQIGDRFMVEEYQYCEITSAKEILTCLHNMDVPMKYFMKAITYCLKTYGTFGKGIYFPDKRAWEDSVNNSGYLKSIQCIGV